MSEIPTLDMIVLALLKLRAIPAVKLRTVAGRDEQKRVFYGQVKEVPALGKVLSCSPWVCILSREIFCPVSDYLALWGDIDVITKIHYSVRFHYWMPAGITTLFMDSNEIYCVRFI